MGGFKKGDRVSFVHEGAGHRIYGVVDHVDGDSIFVIADSRTYEVSADFDDIRAE